MKISASYWLFEGGLEANKPITEAMQEAKDLGFDAIELAIASKGVLTHQVTKVQCEDILATSQKIGIEISSVASGENWIYSPTSNNDEVRKKSIDFTRKAIQITKWLGTDAYLYIPGAVDVFFLPEAGVIPYDVCFERACDAIRQILPGAEEAGFYCRG